MKHFCKKLLQHLRELFSSNNSQIFVPSRKLRPRKLRRVDKDAYNRKYAGRRATHNRHEQNK